MSTQSIKEILALAEQLLAGREFLLGTVVERLDKVAEEFPHDAAVRTLHAALNRRLSKQGAATVISQSELKDMYDQVAGLGNAQVFEENLGDLLPPKSVKAARDYSEFVGGLRDSGEPDLELVESERVQEISSLFGSDVKSAAASFLESGKTGIKMDLEDMGFANSKISIAAQNKNFVIYAADFDTKWGRVSALIPAEIKLGSVLLPSVFVSGNDFVEFNKANMQLHSQNFKGSLTVSAAAVLDHLAKLTKTAGETESNWDTVSAPGAEMIFDERFHADLIGDSQPHEIMGLQAEAVAMPEDLKPLTASLEQTLVETGLSVGRDIVLKAKQVISSELRAAGLRHESLMVTSEFDGGFVVSANIIGTAGKKEISVPVEVVGKSVLMPSTFTSGAIAKPFTVKALQSFASSKDEGGFNASLSDKSFMNFKQLYDRTIRSAAAGNFVDVEENLAIINDRFGADFHRAAFEDLMKVVKVAQASDNAAHDSELDRYIEEYTSTSSDRESNIKMMQNIKYIDIE